MSKEIKKERGRIAKIRDECLKRNKSYVRFKEDYDKNPDKYHENLPMLEGESKEEWLEKVKKEEFNELHIAKCKEFGLIEGRTYYVEKYYKDGEPPEPLRDAQTVSQIPTWILLASVQLLPQ